MNGVRKKISLVLILSILSLNFPLTLADNTSVTAEEKTKVETEVLKLQSNIFNSSKTILEKLTDEFTKITNYEETGSTKFDISMDESTFFGKGNATLNLNKYSAKASGLDSEISSDIDFKLDYAPLYGSGMNIDLSTFASMISKDSEIYLKLKDLNFKVTDENIGKILEAVKSEFSDNKFVKMPTDENSKMAINALKNFSLTNILTEAESISKTPLLTTYKKDGNKYLLIPTKKACDKYFEVTNRLNSTSAWYEPKSCSDTVYNSMVVKFIKSGDLYLTLSDTENTLGFYAEDNGEILDSTLVYDDVSINKFDFIITGKDDDFVLRYEKNKFLNSLLDYGDGVSVFNFDSKLDENNRFTEINSSFNFNKDFTGNFILKDKKITGMFYSKEKGYDYTSDNYEYKLKNVFASKITGTLNDDNTIKNLNAKLIGVSVADKKAFLVGKLNLANGNISYSLNASDNTGKFSLSGTGKYDKKYFKLDSKYDVNGLYTGKINYLVDTRNNKSDGKVYFDVNQASKQVFKLNLETSGTRIYKDDVKIEVPNDYKEFDVEKWDDATGFGIYKSESSDAKRIAEISNLRNFFEIELAKSGELPETIDEVYPNFGKDDVNYGKTINGCTFGYKYEVSSDKQKYRISTCVESNRYINRAKNDGGIYDNMYELSNY